MVVLMLLLMLIAGRLAAPLAAIRDLGRVRSMPPVALRHQRVTTGPYAVDDKVVPSANVAHK
jgi:hypothetical protein